MEKLTTNAKTKDKRQLIIESAFELFFKKGYTNTKIIEIADLANIGKGTFYEYFKSKESLLKELLNLRFEAEKENLNLISIAEISPSEKIKQFFQIEIKSMENHGPKSNVLAQEMMSSSLNCSYEIKIFMHDMFMYKYNFIIKVIKEGIENKEFRPNDPSLVATSIFGSLTFYTAFKYNFMDYHIMPGLGYGNSEWNDEEFIEMIFSGIK